VRERQRESVFFFNTYLQASFSYSKPCGTPVESHWCKGM